MRVQKIKKLKLQKLKEYIKVVVEGFLLK